MATYNGIRVPESIRTCMIISAFQNEIDYSKVELYADVMREEMLNHNFPPIMGYPSILTEDDVDQSQQFLSGEDITEDHIGQLAWFVTDGHHRSLAAIEANLPTLPTTLDYNTITNETDLKNFNN